MLDFDSKMLKELGSVNVIGPTSDGAVPGRQAASSAEQTAGTEESLACGACGLVIAERWYLKAADRPWHCACLRCCHCRVALAGELTCFARDGNIYCKEDYYR